MINNKQGNSNADMNKFAEDIERILRSNPNSANIENILSEEAKSISKAYLLNSYVNNIDKPILKGYAREIAGLASSWVNDPVEVLCCLIQGIWSMYASSIDKSTSVTDISNNWLNFQKWVDSLIMLIDLLIVLLTDDCKSISIKIPDFLKEITDAAFGAMLLIIQQSYVALRESAVGSIIGYLDSKSGPMMDNLWAKCLPFARLLDIIKRYIHDYGLFANIFEKIQGYTTGVASEWKEYSSKVALLPSQLQFLYFARDLLYKLKFSSGNYELCVNFSYRRPDNTISENVTADELQNIVRDELDLTTSQARQKQRINTTSDGTILVDSDNVIPLLTNSSIRGFLNKYYGYPTEVVDNILARGTSMDHIQGTLINSDNVSNLNADCPNTPSPQDLLAWTRAIALQGKE